MNTAVAICIVALLPMTMAVSCYQCAAGSGGCSDPFNKTGSGVSTTGTDKNYAYCKKLVMVGVALRTGEMTCDASKFVLNSGTACCETDLCNTAPTHSPMSSIFIISFFLAIFAKIQWF